MTYHYFALFHANYVRALGRFVHLLAIFCTLIRTSMGQTFVKQAAIGTCAYTYICLCQHKRANKNKTPYILKQITLDRHGQHNAADSSGGRCRPCLRRVVGGVVPIGALFAGAHHQPVRRQATLQFNGHRLVHHRDGHVVMDTDACRNTRSSSLVRRDWTGFSSSAFI